MKKGLCIVNAFSRQNSIEHFFQRMKKELADFSVGLEKKGTDDIFAYLDSTGSLRSLVGEADFVLFLDKDLYLSNLLEKAGYTLYNSASSVALCDDKMLTHMALMDEGILMPKTVSAPLNYTGIKTTAFLDNLEKQLSYPMVAKSNFGSLGRQVHLIKDRKDLDAFEESHLSSPRLYQEFIESSCGTDYRVIVIGGRVAAAMRRHNENDFRSNISLGGVGEKTTLTPEQIEISTKAAGLLGLDYCGVDLLEGPDGEPILCEVNSNAFLTEIEKVTGVNVARRYSELIASRLS